jgi:hypothetical protein
MQSRMQNPAVIIPEAMDAIRADTDGNHEGKLTHPATEP